ncbi:MAG: lycopene cyclase [Saprospiraceae bacterium]|nr:lycopene cyclase [Saprospiraceae bacterium]
MNIHTTYDFIITGTGAAGLMVAYRMSLDSYFEGKKILLIDRDNKTSNDRTWCYWEKGTGEWDFLLAKTWENIYFGSKNYSGLISLGGYKYKMLRSSDFYSFVYKILRQNPQFEFVTDDVVNISETNNGVMIETKYNQYHAKKVFNSILDTSIIASQNKFPYLKQHFVGWFVKAVSPVFKENQATFMDFKIHQKGNTRFMYVLPTSPYEALIEYTLFSEKLLKIEEYEEEIKLYLTNLGVSDYKITEKEQGNIPMTSYPFEKNNSLNLMQIGSAGGWTKASTGYTFAKIAKNTKALIEYIKYHDDFRKFYCKNRYWYFDLIFLDVLHRNNELGSVVFSSIFKDNDIKDVFMFLDEKGSWFDDAKIMFKTKPSLQFVISAILNLPKMFKK